MTQNKKTDASGIEARQEVATVSIDDPESQGIQVLRVDLKSETEFVHEAYRTEPGTYKLVRVDDD